MAAKYRSHFSHLAISRLFGSKRKLEDVSFQDFALFADGFQDFSALTQPAGSTQ